MLFSILFLYLVKTVLFFRIHFLRKYIIVLNTLKPDVCMGFGKDGSVAVFLEGYKLFKNRICCLST